MKTYQLILVFTILALCQCENYYEQCKAATTKESCKAVELDSPNYQCCYTNLTTANNGEFECREMNNEDYESYTISSTYYYYRENIGFECYDGRDRSYESKCDNPGDQYYVFECKRGTVYKTPEIYIFSEAEKSILREEQHCFSYTKLAFSGSDVEINKNDCLNAKLTGSKKNMVLHVLSLNMNLQLQLKIKLKQQLAIY